MAPVPRLLTVSALLITVAAAAAAAQPLKAEWSRPVGDRTRLVGVEEYGRCSVFVDNGAVQVVAPSGEVSWTWPFKAISKYINPRDVAVSHACDAIAFVGDASYKYVWIVDRSGASASIKFVATPADAEFDRAGKYVAVGTYAGSMFLYSINGELQWQRDTKTALVSDLIFSDDNQRIIFRGWGGAGVVDVNGQVEWGILANRLAASRDLKTLVISNEPNHGPGLPSIAVTDAQRNDLWHRWADTEAFVSAAGDRIFAAVDDDQVKKEEDFFARAQRQTIQLLSRDGSVVQSFPEYETAVALSEDGTRVWVGIDDLRVLNCINDRGEVLAGIETGSLRDIRVSRDFSQVMVVTERDLHPVSVERYVVPAPCRK